MFSSKRLDRIEALQERIYVLQDQMHERLRDIDIALIVREPGTARAAEAYEGLRKSVAAATRERRQHLAQLVEFVDAIERGATIETLRRRCEEWCLEAGLERRSDVVPEWFSVVEGEGPVLEVLDPAWVDGTSGQLVKQGTARRLPGEIAAETVTDGSDRSDDAGEAGTSAEVTDDAAGAGQADQAGGSGGEVATGETAPEEEAVAAGGTTDEAVTRDAAAAGEED